MPELTRRVGDQQAGCSSNDYHEAAYQQQRGTPVQFGNHQGSKRGQRKGAGADTGDGYAGCESATAVEPFLDCADGGDVGQPDASPNTDGECCLNLP